MKTLAITALIATVSISAASAKCKYDGAENCDERRATIDLSLNSVSRDIAGTRKKIDGTSDAGARYRLERSCIAALESRVENTVRRTYGCHN